MKSRKGKLIVFVIIMLYHAPLLYFALFTSHKSFENILRFIDSESWYAYSLYPSIILTSYLELNLIVGCLISMIFYFLVIQFLIFFLRNVIKLISKMLKPIQKWVGFFVYGKFGCCSSFLLACCFKK